MMARKVSTARQLHHPHEARGLVVVVKGQQATECRRRKVDHGVSERKPAFRNDGGIILALQNLDELLLHMLRLLYGLDADKHYLVEHSQYNSLLYKVYDGIQVHVRDVNMPTCCAYWLFGYHKNTTSTTCYIESIDML